MKEASLCSIFIVRFRDVNVTMVWTLRQHRDLCFLWTRNTLRYFKVQQELGNLAPNSIIVFSLSNLEQMGMRLLMGAVVTKAVSCIIDPSALQSLPPRFCFRRVPFTNGAAEAAYVYFYSDTSAPYRGRQSRNCTGRSSCLGLATQRGNLLTGSVLQPMWQPASAPRRQNIADWLLSFLLIWWTQIMSWLMIAEL